MTGSKTVSSGGKPARDGTAIDWIVDAARAAVLAAPFLFPVAHPAQAAERVALPIDPAAIEAPAPALAAYGPFRVVDATTVEVDGVIDFDSPRQFSALLARYPGVHVLRLVDCPGTEDDDANLALARMVRARGMDTHVPSGGSVRSGGVELFLAGIRRTAENGAEFGVHSWQDEDGLEAADAPADDPIHQAYLGYYREVGLSAETAREFYAFTNQTRFDDIRWMTPAELARFHITN